MLKLLALVPLLMNTGNDHYRIAQETNMAPGVSAPSPYATISAPMSTETKPPAAKTDEATARLRYALSEIARLRNQLDATTGRLDESRGNYAALDAVSVEQADRISKADARSEELRKEITVLHGKLATVVAEKRDVESRIIGLEASRNNAWVYCLLVSIAFAAVLLFVLSFSDSFRAILARLPDKEKDDRIAELEIELARRIDRILILESLNARASRLGNKSKRAGRLIAGLIKHMARLAVNINLLRLDDIQSREEKIAARDAEIDRLVALQQGSEKAFEEAIAEAQSVNDKLMGLESAMVELRTQLTGANETIEALNGGTLKVGAVPQSVEETPTVPIVDQAALLEAAARTSSNADAIDRSRAGMHLPSSESLPIADETPPPGYSR